MSRDVDATTLATTRRGLHAVAETVLAGHQYRVAGTIRLAVTPRGFATRPLPGEPSLLAVRGAELVVTRRSGEDAFPLSGSLGDLASRAGTTFGAPHGVYADATGAKAADVVDVDGDAAAVLRGALTAGDAALRELAARHGRDKPPTPVLWPEHFDVGVSLDDVNYGLSLGDEAIPEPYAYVGPWTPRAGPFWDRPFGAARTMRALADAHEVLAFFEDGRAAAVADPPR